MAGHGIAISAPTTCCRSMPTSNRKMDVKLGAAINIDLTLDQTMGDAKVKLVFSTPAATSLCRQDQVERVGDPQRLGQLRSGRNEVR